MRKSILLSIGVLSLIFASCKKDVVEPTPTVVTQSNYSIHFLAGSYDATHYTDVVIKINGDSIGVLSSHTTTLSIEDIADYYETNGEFPFFPPLEFSAQLGLSYNIEAFTSSGELIGSTGSKPLILVDDNDFGGDKPWLTDDSYNGSPNSPVGVDGNDCHFFGVDETLLLVFELEN